MGRASRSKREWELVMGGIDAEDAPGRKRFRATLRRFGLRGSPIGAYEWAVYGSKADLRRWLEATVSDGAGAGRDEVDGHLRRAVEVGA